ncbi:hypothetical protein [Pseudoalteromonas luteoviolacea]|uniref:hypothetical protein n=1 Tax=Pseudoalteromonas luteoviolacea TaxID=43657 RepID=UPI001B36C8D8|nr:hypothetical protein [Pseudoalteromonas luteoviolacea]MBQ4836133.1 hypothetical protein [Pseudoalteromonas luteoviolacea]
MTEFAYSIAFKNNYVDRKVLAVFFVIFAFLLLVLIPELWWLHLTLCYLGYRHALFTCTKIMPKEGDITLIEKDIWFKLASEAKHSEGTISYGKVFASLLIVEVRCESGEKVRLAFMASAMGSDAWSHLSRIALQAK